VESIDLRRYTFGLGARLLAATLVLDRTEAKAGAQRVLRSQRSDGPQTAFVESSET